MISKSLNYLIIGSILLCVTGCQQGKTNVTEAPVITIEKKINPVDPPKQEKTPLLPTVLLPDGQLIKLELAITSEEITQGLMFRPSLASDRGMLFLFKQERFPNFWMKNTLIPLDIIFLDPNAKVVDITHRAHPCAVEPCPQFVPRGPAMAVLELNSGAAEEHGIEIASTLVFSRVPNYPALGESTN